MNEILNACVDDIVIANIYKSDLLFGSDEKLPSKVSHFDNTPIFDQHKAGDNMGCTVYGLTHTKHDTENKVTLSPTNEWKKALKIGADEKKGRGMSGALSMFKREKNIKGYSLAQGVDVLRSIIATKSSAVYTGSSKIDRVATKKRQDKMAVFKAKGLGHAFEISGYDDFRQDKDKKYTGAFECKNSNDNFPRFRVPYDLIHILFSTIEIFVDDNRKDEVKQANDEAMIKQAIDLGITNGANIKDLATRGQIAVMIYRALTKNRNAEYETALIKAKEIGIRNGEREKDNAKRQEVMIMCGRVVLGKYDNDQQAIDVSIQKMITTGSNPNDMITRQDAILMIMRMYNVTK